MQEEEIYTAYAEKYDMLTKYIHKSAGEEVHDYYIIDRDAYIARQYLLDSGIDILYMARTLTYPPDFTERISAITSTLIAKRELRLTKLILDFLKEMEETI